MCLLAVVRRRRRPASLWPGMGSFFCVLGSSGWMWIFAGFGRKGNGFVGLGVSVWLGLRFFFSLPLFIFDLFWTKPATACLASWYRHLGPGASPVYSWNFSAYKFVCSPGLLQCRTASCLGVQGRASSFGIRLGLRCDSLRASAAEEAPFDRSIEVVFARGRNAMVFGNLFRS